MPEQQHEDGSDLFERLEFAEKLDDLAEAAGMQAALVCLPGQHKRVIKSFDIMTLGEGTLPVGWYEVRGHIVEDEEALVPSAVYDPDSNVIIAVCEKHYTEFTGEPVPS